jgi:hypothetical protein
VLLDNIFMTLCNPLQSFDARRKSNVKKVNCDAVSDGLGDDPLRHQLEQSHHPGWQPCRLHRQVHLPSTQVERAKEGLAFLNLRS